MTVEQAGRRDQPPYQIGLKERLVVALRISADSGPALAHFETDRSKYLEEAGFCQRMQTLHGSFFTRAEIRESGRSSLTQLSVTCVASGSSALPAGRMSYFVRRSAQTESRDGSTAPRVALDETNLCHPSVYVNGTITRRASVGDPATTLDDVESIDNVEAIELYQVTDVPPKFTRYNETCGAIVLWRRRG